MYYEFPEEDMAYASDMHGNFAQYFFCSSDVFVAPVVQNSTVVGPSYSYGGMAPKTIWVPPGEWLEIPTGQIHHGDNSPLSKLYDITEIPVFVKVGSMLPSQPVTLGETVGLAYRGYSELEFTIFQAAAAGKTVVYEDGQSPCLCLLLSVTDRLISVL